MYILRAAFAAMVVLVASIPTFAQTTAGSSPTIVVPVTAQTASFTSEITVYNPNGVAVTVDVAFYEANNSTNPGLRTCIDLAVPAGKSVQSILAVQCALGPGSHFGLLVLSDVAGTNPIYGYVRTQNLQGIGFSTEGFPAENFNNQVSHATGLKKTTSGLIYQTNCFVGSLASPANYTLKLFNGTSGAQIGSTITGSLGAFQQTRYLDVFAAPPNGVGPIAGDQLNVRAEFASTNNALLVGFCTVQDNTSFGADFRIAKSYGTTTAFVQGGNSFGTTAILGTTDNQPLDVRVNGSRVMRYEPDITSPRVIGGNATNVASGAGATVGGGGTSSSGCLDPIAVTYTRPCRNAAINSFATVAGGHANIASAYWSTVGGGDNSTASGPWSVVGGGQGNTASGENSTVGGGAANSAIGYSATVGGGQGNYVTGNGATVGGGQGNLALQTYATVAGGYRNQATGVDSTVPGGESNYASGTLSLAAGFMARANGHGCFVWGDYSTSNTISCNADNRFVVRSLGGVFFFAGGDTQATYTGVALPPGGTAWVVGSDRSIKDHVYPVDPADVLERVVSLPISTWNLKSQDAAIRHMGPMAQDFRQAFSLGETELGISTIDADGVAFAAIQGLNAKLESKVAEQAERLAEERAARQAQARELEAQRAEIAELKRAVDLLLARTSPEGRVATAR